ncbi:phospholipase A2 A2-actitoxin-Cgg2a-like isoform X2 [Stylophora pistillata]|uniref:phospholipase A2 A2-actitoxin-Cgg2a-like isoform X2 n=1 Tax=Stylophora pistillata TaxID=50429 RepID=UPI000C03A438|nr:phospholipase A2 A2-actitoxin-Cgg2a-like isoform X2 [Stylophora pistillata]
MERLVFLLHCLAIFQVTMATSPLDQDREGILAQKESADSPITSPNARSILEFGLMIICGVKRNPLDYNGYGCYCGLGGQGTPVDDVDRCCQIHDACYNAVQNSGACTLDLAIYAMPYDRKGCLGCEPASHYWFFGECRNSLCVCDSEAVQCFQRATFNDAYKDYSQEKC